jgi:hypothetical protein
VTLKTFVTYVGAVIIGIAQHSAGLTLQDWQVWAVIGCYFLAAGVPDTPPSTPKGNQS